VQPAEQLGVSERVVGFWRAMDDLFDRVRSTWWGAVVTDARFPSIWDANYARVDVASNELHADEIDTELLPALSAAGARWHHVVVFQPGLTAQLLTELSGRGLRLGWDAVMEHRAETPPISEVSVEEISPGADLWDRVAASLSLFGTRSSEALDELMRIERDVMTPGGKRWFGVRNPGGELVSIGALLLLDGVAYLDNVATFPEARRRGLASAVTTVMTGEAQVAGALSTWLLADPGEPGIIAMYERLGFVPAGRIASTKGPVPGPAGARDLTSR
jgi:GNAT superfamily N-acetyltransferase